MTIQIYVQVPKLNTIKRSLGTSYLLRWFVVLNIKITISVAAIYQNKQVVSNN